MKLKLMWLIACISLGQTALFSQTPCSPFLSTSTTSLQIECGEEIPPFTDVMVSAPCCEGDLMIHSKSVETGSPSASCTISTALGPGPDWAFWLPGVNPSNVSWHFDTPGSMAVLPDGNALITGHIRSANDPNQGFDVFVLLENKRNWTDWSALNRSYKDDLNLAGNEYLNWDYYEMADGLCYLNGTGSLAGSQLILTPKPSNYYFGFQVGNAANNKNANYGISGWFFYNGTINGTSVSGHGDINADLSCQNISDECLNTTITRFTSAVACGRLSAISQSIQISDTIAPEFAEDVASEVVSTCEQVGSITVSATDNCSSVSISFVDNILEEGCNGLVQRVYTATDACGNQNIFVQTIDLQSTENLEFIIFPEDTSIACNLYNSEIQPSISFTSGCGEVILSFDDEIIAGNCTNNFTVLRTYTITDACGASVSQTWTVNVFDTTPPTIFNTPSNTSISCGEIVEGAEVFALDLCDGITEIAASAETIQNECGFTFIRTWSATDGCGNTTSTNQVITIIDDTPPMFTSIPQGGSFACESIPSEVELPAAEDACSAVNVTYSDTVLTAGCIQTLIRTFTATDACGNTASVAVEYIYGDNIPPSFGEAPAIIALNCSEADNFEIEVFDNCDDVELTFVDTPLNDCGGSYIREYTAIDGCQNFNTLVIQFNITDMEAPVLVSTPEDVFLNCGDALPALVNPEFSDNCSTIEVFYNGEEIIEGNCEGSYQVVRTWVAVDECQNITFASQNIFVQDITPPVFVSTPGPVTIQCGDPLPTEAPVVEDNCGFVNLSLDETILQMPCGSMIIREWTATDDCGNSAVTSQTISISDDTAPVFNIYPEDITLSCSDPIPPIPNISGLDICSGSVQVLTTEITSPGECEGSYIITRIFRAFDDCSNEAIYAQTITIVDTEAPEFINPASYIEVSCNNFQQPAINIQDACSSFDVFFEDDQVVPGCGGLIERIYTAIDGCGNISQFEQTVQLIDNTAPILLNLPPANLNIECGSPIPDVFIFAQDNCSGIVPVGLQATTTNNGCTDIFTRTWFAVDDCGNTSEFTQTITASDNTAPVLSATPANITLPCDAAIPSVPQIIANDACDGFVDVVFSQSSNPLETCSSITRTWCAVDCSGNEVCHTQTISFSDTPGSVISPFFRVVSDAESVLAVRWIAPEALNVEIDVYTLSGQKVASLFNGEINGGMVYTIPIDPDQFATGVYVVLAKSNAGTFSDKLFIR